ncbi:MAG: protease HtpX [Planctomycetes bacterium]|nr:protease HtpX [Planctomycetota bacterium]
MNYFKTVVLMGVLTALVVVIADLLGGPRWAVMGLIFAALMNLFTYWFSDKIVLMMYGAQPVTAQEAPQLHREVSDLAQRAGLPMPRLYIIPSESPNAFATGRNPSHAAVAVTEGCMRMLSRNELRGVLAHELAHVQNRDILIATIAATLAAAITFLARMAWFVPVGRSDDDDHRGGNPLVMLLMLIVAPLAAMLIQMAISRAREYAADRRGAQMAGGSDGLAGALAKLANASRYAPMHQAGEATAHLFIVNPLTASSFLTLFSTHPPIEERIKRLREMV